MLNYTKLWLLLEKKGMKRTDLKQIMSGNTLAKLGKNETVSSEVLGKICDFLNCQPSDIMENVTREDIIKAGEVFNQKMGELLDVINATTGMSTEALFEEFMKEAPAYLERIKNGDRDFIGLQDYIDKADDKRA